MLQKDSYINLVKFDNKLKEILKVLCMSNFIERLYGFLNFLNMGIVIDLLYISDVC